MTFLGHGQRQRLSVRLAHLRRYPAELGGLRRQRRSPAMIVKPPSPSGASVSGVVIPWRLIDAASSAICSSPNSLRGLSPLLGLIVRQPWDIGAASSNRLPASTACRRRRCELGPVPPGPSSADIGSCCALRATATGRPDDPASRVGAAAVAGNAPESEAWFDRYVTEHGHDPGEAEPDLGIEKKPDRLIRWNDVEVVCEIKQFDRDPFGLLLNRVGVLGLTSVLRQVRKAVERAAKAVEAAQRLGTAARCRSR